MRTPHIPSVVSVSTLFCLVATTAAAEGRIMNLRPILLPPASSSSWKMPTAPNMNACKNLGETSVVGTVHFCKMLCGINVKIEVCPKE